MLDFDLTELPESLQRGFIRGLPIQGGLQQADGPDEM